MSDTQAHLTWGMQSAELVIGDPRTFDDVERIARSGVTTWQVPLSWAELQPEGRGPLSRGALDFYRRLCDQMLERGISPLFALADGGGGGSGGSGGALPGRLERARGWHNRDTAGRFADYAALCVRAVGDRAVGVVTHVDPRRTAFGILGEPVSDRELKAGLVAAHHLLLSHLRAVEAARAERSSLRVGITLGLAPASPYGDDEHNLRATAMCHQFTNRWWLDPLVRGAYPSLAHDAVVAAYGPLEVAREGDFAGAAPSLDWLGVEYTRRLLVETAPREPLGFRVCAAHPDLATTDDGLEIVPRALEQLLGALGANQSLPPLWLSIGAAYRDDVAPDGRVHDRRRVAYLRDHLEVALAARTRGVPLEAVLVRTALDPCPSPSRSPSRSTQTSAVPPASSSTSTSVNGASLAQGATPGSRADSSRFTGLFHVDPATGERAAKDSARYLERVLRDGFEHADPR